MLKLKGLKTPLIWALSRPLVCTLLSPFTREQVSVFMLHRLHAPESGVFGHTAEFLQEMLDRLRRDRYEFISLDRLSARMTGADPRPLRRAVAFTIDDGYADQAQMIRDVFIPFDCPVTVFAITGFIDGKLWPWDAKIRHILFASSVAGFTLETDGWTITMDLRDDASRRRSAGKVLERCKHLPYSKCLSVIDELQRLAEVVLPERPPPAFEPMSWDMARALESEGVRFGPHSVSHASLATLSSDEALAEIEESWRRLQQELVSPLQLFAYPSGIFGVDFSEREIRLAQAAGFPLALSADTGYVRPVHEGMNPSALWRLRRFSLPQTTEDVLQCASWIEMAKEALHGRGRPVGAHP